MKDNLTFDPTTVRTDLMPEAVPFAVLVLIALAAVFAWCVMHRVLRRQRARVGILARFLAVAPIATAAAWCLFQAAARLFWLAGGWPLWVAAVVSGVAMEGVALLYEHEALITPPRLARGLVFCRLTVIALTVFILLQPVFVTEHSRVIKRRVAVLADESASMWHPDTSWRLSEALDVAQALGDIVPALRTNRPPSREVDLAVWDKLTQEERTVIREHTEVPRAELTRKLLTGTTEAQPQSLHDKLRGRYDVNAFRFGRDIQPIADIAAFATNAVPEPDTRETAFRASTDFTHALEHVMNTVPSEELAGVLFLTDGRHTGESSVTPITRRLAQAGVPVSSIVIGGTQPLFDIAVADVRVPETVFLGDRVRMTVAVQATAAKGKEAKLRLTCNDELVTEETLRIDTDETWTREIRLTDTPKEQGLRHYRVSITPLDGEASAENNTWNTDVFVTDDRTNVLLVDNRPRWEYRYLRNLFYGRDKSVHLQFALMRPDEIADVIPPTLPNASATRAFGDAEAGGLPGSREEWRMFDIIILGDVGDDVLTPETVENIRYCVEERGALLVVIAGPEQMPYNVQGEAFRDLLPVVYTPGAASGRKAGESSFQIKLSPAGRSHDVMRMSASATENEQIWTDMPELRWRLPLDDVKPGADVLAYAIPTGTGDDHIQAAYRAVAEAMNDPEEATKRLADVRRVQAQNALVVVKNQGQGKVMMLTTDRTWRFRYRVGDTLHHRFWGQVMRWGTGEKLRSGNALVRLGTDMLNYMPTENVQVLARLSTPDFAPLVNAHPEAVLTRDGRELRRVQLRYRKDSNGIYEGLLDPLAETGAYTLTLRCPEAREQLGDGYPDNLETQFSVVTTRRPAEFISLTADYRIPQQMAQASGGRAVSPAEAHALWDTFGEGNRTVTERLERNLWDSWWLFVIITVLLTTEWLLRKKAGLA